MKKRDRRGRGEGGIRELPDGTWEARASYVDGQGKRRRPAFSGKSKAEALQKMRDYLSRKDKGQVADAGKLTVSQYLDTWLEGKKASIEPATYAAYSYHAKFIKSAVGRHRLASLTAVHVAAMYPELERAGVSAYLQRKCGTTLGTALQHAVFPLRLIPANPAADVPKPRSPRREMKALDAEQCKAFLTAAKEDRLYPLYVVWIASGAGEGELFALLWSDVDIDGKAISITKCLEELNGRHRVKDTKVKTRRRRVALPTFAVDVLAEHKQAMEAAGLYGPDRPVFCDTQGGYLRRSAVHRRSFQPTLKRAGLPHIRPYDLRHSAATLLLLAGEQVKVVSERLGHSTATLTLNTYQHVLPGMQERAAEKMQNLLG